MIGVSVYLNDPHAIERLQEAKRMGAKKVFTSLHIPEEHGDLAANAKKIMQAAKELDMPVYADVSRYTPKHLNLSSIGDLRELGVEGLRLDDFFSPQEMIELSHQFHIAINASIVFEDTVRHLLEDGLSPERLIAWHNFYPRKETGLCREFFRRQNQMFEKYGIPVAAYIPGVKEKRGPLFAGLPTLEDHREIHPFVAALELWEMGVQEIYISDPGFGELLSELVEYEESQAMPIRFTSETFAGGEFMPRPDFARDLIRLMDTRTRTAVEPHNTVDRPIGTIGQDNCGYGRYQGEIHIAKRDLPADERVNVIGQVIKEDMDRLAYLKPLQKIRLIRVKK
ncbi:MupG family TIM beta-alpha barrel fold protein [Thermoflavimicrobium dichotomicum]|uniref:DUF871 domain-containing protein n=1 Tax=Thermoflavimicrobium dichotomicum TaxID=46223 RepID=A0A1I3T8R1_9BACL|nr:MupG family TIM beta-alpha barrel fold protein [Thermoflavimicrobium dichotomicum]SFJ67454.1 hypothetical protein SAMN05421852_11667 [Thermoflavimicrobium dichotomicum]